MSMSSKLSDDDQNTYNYLLGLSAGWEEAGNQLLDACAKSYRAGYDDNAHLFRDMGEFLKRTSVVKRQELDDWQKEKEGN